MLSLSATVTSLIAQATGKPVEIHDIYLGDQMTEDSDTLHFVNFYRNLSFFQYMTGNVQTYTALGLGRTSIKKTTRSEIDRVGYKIDNVNKAMAAYAAKFDFRNKRIVSRLVFRDELGSANNAKVIFDGFIQSIIFTKKTMEVNCVPIISSLAFETGWPYQINCNAKFGDAFCAINKNASENRVTGTADSGTTSTMIDAALTQTDDYWNHGSIKFDSGDNKGVQRAIVDFDAASDKLTFDYGLDAAVSTGDQYTLFRGCDKTQQMCTNIYNNIINYHGFNAIPLNKNG